MQLRARLRVRAHLQVRRQSAAGCWTPAGRVTVCHDLNRHGSLLAYGRAGRGRPRRNVEDARPREANDRRPGWVPIGESDVRCCGGFPGDVEWQADDVRCLPALARGDALIFLACAARVKGSAGVPRLHIPRYAVTPATSGASAASAGRSSMAERAASEVAPASTAAGRHHRSPGPYSARTAPAPPGAHPAASPVAEALPPARSRRACRGSSRPTSRER